MTILAIKNTCILSCLKILNILKTSAIKLREALFSSVLENKAPANGQSILGRNDLF